MTKIFELVVGYPPFNNFMPEKDELIREWISMFGDLPDEWTDGLPSPRAIGTFTSTSLSIILWSYQRQPVFLSSLRFKTRCLILTCRGPRVRASYTMWLAAWDILWRWQKTILLQSKYWYSRYAPTISVAISPFGPSTSVWFAQSYLVPTQSLYAIAELE